MTSLTTMLIDLGHRLRSAGLPADPEAVRALLRAASFIDPLDPQQVRAASRALVCTRYEHLRIHDAVFDSVFGLSRTLRPTESVCEVPIASPSLRIEGGDGTDGSEITAASRAEYLRHVDLGVDDGAEAAALIDGLDFRRPCGTVHRSRPGPTGAIDARRMLHELIRSEDIPSIPRRRRLHRRRAVTLIADVSASMTPWRDSVLRFLDRGADALHACCFTAGTRLTRVDGIVTGAGPRSGRRGVTTALSEVTDAGAGTRLGDSLAQLLTGLRKDLVRGSVLVVISDGWEHGDCAELERACMRLARISHRFLWVNPRAGRSGFEARTRGLSVATAHAEAVLPATTVAQWQTVAEAIAARSWAHSIPHGRAVPASTTAIGQEAPA